MACYLGYVKAFSNTDLPRDSFFTVDEISIHKEIVCVVALQALEQAEQA